MSSYEVLWSLSRRLVVMKHPFRQKRVNGKLIREFNKDVDSSELVWHRDHADRDVKVCSGKNWQLQLENRLPVKLVPGKTYFIPARTYHRVIKGQSDLVVEIKEKLKMKITRSQLTRIIREHLLLEKSIASVSDLTRNMSVFEEWVDLLIDELTEKLPNGIAINDLKPKTRQAIIKGVSEAAIKYLIVAFGYPQDGYSRRKQAREKDAAAAKRHRENIRTYGS